MTTSLNDQLSDVKYTIIMYETSLELIPKQLLKNNKLKRNWDKNKSRKKGIILDRIHHSDLIDRHLDRKNKRGRPDILYNSILNIIYSPLFLKNKIQLVIHLINNYVFIVPSNWRPPVSYNRFCDVLSQLLLYKQVPIEGKPILKLHKEDLGTLVQNIKPSKLIICDENAENQIKKPTDLQIKFKNRTVFLIGGFQDGQPGINGLFDQLDFDKVKFYKNSKPSWFIISKLVNLLEIIENDII